MPKRKKETPEEQRNRQYKMAKGNINFVPEPTYFFNLGDQVLIGNLEDALIYDILDDGKIYEIDYTHVNHNYGNPIRTPHSKGFWRWMSVRPINNNKETFIDNSDIFISYSQQHMASLFGKVYSFGLDFNPAYQRDYVWDAKDKTSLIDSIFANISIGQFVFSKNGYDAEFLYKVIDGKQRIKTLCNYYENRFTWKGYFFNNLARRMQGHFKDYPVSVGTIKFANEEQEIRAFLMLNKSGKVMPKEHLEHVEKLLKDKGK